MESETLIRKVLKNELTILASVAIAILGFVNTVVIPIQRLQLQVATVQEQIAQQLSENKAIMTDHASFKAELNNLIDKEKTLEQQVNNHLSK